MVDMMKNGSIGMTKQSIAVRLEHWLAREYKIDDLKVVSSFIDAGSIRHDINGFYYAVGMLLLHYYSNTNSKKIFDFHEDLYEVHGKSMDDIQLDVIESILEKLDKLIAEILK